jgi:hypothetical protein
MTCNRRYKIIYSEAGYLEVRDTLRDFQNVATLCCSDCVLDFTKELSNTLKEFEKCKHIFGINRAGYLSYDKEETERETFKRCPNCGEKLEGCE